MSGVRSTKSNTNFHNHRISKHSPRPWSVHGRIVVWCIRSIRMLRCWSGGTVLPRSFGLCNWCCEAVWCLKLSSKFYNCHSLRHLMNISFVILIDFLKCVHKQSDGFHATLGFVGSHCIVLSWKRSHLPTWQRFFGLRFLSMDFGCWWLFLQSATNWLALNIVEQQVLSNHISSLQFAKRFNRL